MINLFSLLPRRAHIPPLMADPLAVLLEMSELRALAAWQTQDSKRLLKAVGSGDVSSSLNGNINSQTL